MSQLRTGLEPVATAGAAALASPALPRWRLQAAARAHWERIALASATAAWIGVFGWLSVVRHLAGGSHAEDLGFTDQVIWNFLRGQWFRMSLYNGATWNTEVDLSHLARPDSLLAFHVEPMLLAFVPLYALGGGAVLLLLVQALALGLGALPAYRLGRHFADGPLGGAAVCVAYLLSPLGQSAVLSDFHTSVIAAPLVLLAAERLLVAQAPSQALLAALAAISAREDVGPAVALLGLSLLVLGADRKTALLISASGVAWTIGAAAVLLHYSGGSSPFGVRYSLDLATALTRPDIGRTALTLLLSGAWLGLFAPAPLLGALPTLAANVLSSSPWMASSGAHYGVLLLPFTTLCVAIGLKKGSRILAPLVIVGSVTGYLVGGYGPLASNYAPATVTPHAEAALQLAGTVPSDAVVSASSTLAPHLSHRAHLYLFPSVLDAAYVALDLQATSAPTSPGDVYLRVRDLLRGGGWRILTVQDGLLLLERDESAPPVDIAPDSSEAPPTAASEPRLLDATLVPSPQGDTGVDGPRWILRTTWQADAPVAPGTHLDFWIDLQGGERVHVWDVASLWWLPPDRWIPGQPVTVDIPDVPLRRFVSWSAQFTTP